jgi:lipopolysaccharide export system protein LptA
VTLLIAVPVLASAQDFKVDFGVSAQDPDAPVEVTADSLAINQENGSAEFAGNVMIIQGDMKMQAPLVNVFYNEAQDGVERLVGNGGVMIVSGQDTAEAETAEYDVEGGLIYMRGKVILVQGINSISSETMTVNLNDSTAQMHGRVRTVLRPKDN